MKTTVRIILTLIAMLGITLSGIASRAELLPGVLKDRDLLVSAGGGVNGPGKVQVFDGTTGAFKGDLVSPGSGPLSDTWGITNGPTGDLFLVDYFLGAVKRYNGTTGASLGDFLPEGSLASVGIAFGPDGTILLSGGFGISRYNAITGEYIDNPVTADVGELQYLLFGADGKLYMGNYSYNEVDRWDPITGIIDVFVQPGDGGLAGVRQMAFGPDGNLYIASEYSQTVKRFDGRTGAYIDDFVAPGLVQPLGLAFGPDGNLYVEDCGVAKVIRYNGTTGTYIDVFAQDVSATYIHFAAGVTAASVTTDGMPARVTVTPIPTTSLTYDSVVTPGNTAVTPLDSVTSALPANFQVLPSSGGTPTFMHVETSATFTGTVEISILYDPALTGGSAPALLHFVDGAWVDITTSVDTINHRVYGRTSSFSPFAVAIPASDTTPPVITIGAPIAGAIFTLNQVVAANYSATDTGSGIHTVAGTVPNGSVINTGSAGAKTFMVNASDVAGNTSSKSVGYTVKFNHVGLFDQTKAYKSGSTLPIKVRLTDANAANVSASSIVVSAASVIRITDSAPGPLTDSGNANPDYNFRYDASLGGYIYNLSLKGYATGTYRLSFTAGADPTLHTVEFQVK